MKKSVYDVSFTIFTFVNAGQILLFMLFNTQPHISIGKYSQNIWVEGGVICECTSAISHCMTATIHGMNTIWAVAQKHARYFFILMVSKSGLIFHVIMKTKLYM